MSIEERDKLFDECKGIYQKDVVLISKDKPYQEFIVDALKIEGDGIICHYHPLLQTATRECAPLHFIIKNFNIKANEVK